MATLQERLFAEDVAYGQSQSAKEVPGGSVIDPTWISAGASVLGKALSPSGAGPSNATGYNHLDSSGWVVAFKGDATGATQVPWYWIAGAVLLGVVWMKKR